MTTRSPIPAGDPLAQPTYDRVDDEAFGPLVDDGDPWEAFFAAEAHVAEPRLTPTVTA